MHRAATGDKYRATDTYQVAILEQWANEVRVELSGRVPTGRDLSRHRASQDRLTFIDFPVEKSAPVRLAVDRALAPLAER